MDLSQFKDGQVYREISRETVKKSQKKGVFDQNCGIIALISGSKHVTMFFMQNSQKLSQITIRLWSLNYYATGVFIMLHMTFN